VGEDAGPVWEASGYRVLYLGDEAVVDPRAFSLEGRAIRKVRQDCARLERQGYTVEWHRSGDMHPDLRRALVHVSHSWRGGDEERGFTMTLGRLFDERDPACLVAVARDGAGYARGFLHFVPASPRGFSLDVMRRDRDTPTGLNEFLIARTLEHLRAEGVEVVSLNFAFLRGILRPTGRLSIGQRFQRWLAVRLGPWFQIESLYRFNNKFGPAWVPRYAAYEDALAVPSVLLAAMRAEGLLDLSILRRGQGGKRKQRAPIPA
jgi:lysyl-tRNA synthetase class 2